MAAKRPPALDRIDIRILAALQANGRMTVQKLAETVGLSARPCLERMRRLEAAGIIAGYRAVIDIVRLSRPVTVFAEIALEKQARQDEFEKRIDAIDEVVECWQVSGASDYFALFVCPDIAHYEAMTNALIDNRKLGVARVVSHIVLRPVHKFRGYPLAVLTPRR